MNCSHYLRPYHTMATKQTKVCIPRFAEATKNFLTTVILDGNDYPQLSPSGWVHVIILGFWTGKHIDNRVNGGVSPYYEACVMDGSKAVFRVRFSASSKGHLNTWLDSMKPGNILRVSNYSLIWFHGIKGMKMRLVMLVDKFR